MKAVQVCSTINGTSWDDGVITGPRLAISRALSIIQERGPAFGLFIKVAKCELFSLSDLSMFPSGTKKSNVPHFEILGSPIGDAIFCAKYVSQKCAIASKLLTQLENVGSVDPPSCFTPLAPMRGFCKLVDLATSTPPSIVAEGFKYFDNDVCLV